MRLKDVKIIAIDKKGFISPLTKEHQFESDFEIKDLYWFEENGVREDNGYAHTGEYEFHIELPHCKDCKYWERIDWRDFENKKNYGNCDKEISNEYLSEYAYTCVTEDFGCKFWERREK